MAADQPQHHVPQCRRRWFQFSLRTLLAIPLLLACLFAVYWYTIGQIPMSCAYHVKASFASMPADDQRLEQWLKAQPGVHPRFVNVRREGQTLLIDLGMTRTLGGPPFPDLSKGCASLGYSDQVSEWIDVRPGERSKHE